MPRPTASPAPSRRELVVRATTAGEPRVTLYTNQWKEARARAAELRGTKSGAVWRRLLDHQERGWEYVRPLACAVEEARCWTTGPQPATALYQFTDVEIVDLYRYNAFRCADMVLGPDRSDWIPSTEDIDAETDAFYRNVSLLRLASAHSLVPPEFRLLTDQMAGLDGWYAEFGGVFAPAAEAFNRLLSRAGPRSA